MGFKGNTAEQMFLVAIAMMSYPNLNKLHMHGSTHFCGCCRYRTGRVTYTLKVVHITLSPYCLTFLLLHSSSSLNNDKD